MMEKLTIQEEEAMFAVWKSKGGLVRDIRMFLEDQDLPYTTLASTLKNLQKKGYLDSTPEGNALHYTPKISQESYKKNRLSKLVTDHFKNSYKDLVTFFAQEEAISKEDLEDIIDMIQQKRSK